jgi:hypothetical protein
LAVPFQLAQLLKLAVLAPAGMRGRRDGVIVGVTVLVGAIVAVDVGETVAV